VKAAENRRGRDANVGTNGVAGALAYYGAIDLHKKGSQRRVSGSGEIMERRIATRATRATG